jgi:hypothetical protein
LTQGATWQVGETLYVTLGNAAQVYTVEPAKIVKPDKSARISVKRGVKLQLEFEVDSADYEFKTSNAQIADVDEKGYVITEKVGTVLITLTALDGSGKVGAVALTVLP